MEPVDLRFWIGIRYALVFSLPVWAAVVWIVLS